MNTLPSARISDPLKHLSMNASCDPDATGFTHHLRSPLEACLNNRIFRAAEKVHRFILPNLPWGEVIHPHSSEHCDYYFSTFGIQTLSQKFNWIGLNAGTDLHSFSFDGSGISQTGAPNIRQIVARSALVGQFCAGDFATCMSS